MTITALPTPPSRQRPSTFSAEGDAFLAALPTFVTEANAMAAAVNADENSAANSASSALGSAASASSYSAVAAGSANFRGSWSSLTGALAVPATVWHSNRMWLLLSNLVDVTAKEPGVDVEWVEIGTTAKSTGEVVITTDDLSSAGFLPLDNSTALQVSYAALYAKLGQLPRPEVITPGVGTTGRTAYFADDSYIYAYVYDSTSLFTIDVYSKADYTKVTTITAADDIRGLASNSTHLFVALEASPFLAIYAKSGWGSVTPPTLTGLVYAIGADESYIYLNQNTAFTVINASTFAIVAGTATAAMTGSYTRTIIHDSTYVYCIGDSAVTVIAKSNLSAVHTTISSTTAPVRFSWSSNYISLQNSTSLTIISRSDFSKLTINPVNVPGVDQIATTNKFTILADNNYGLAFYDNSTGDLISNGVLATEGSDITVLLANDRDFVVSANVGFTLYSESFEEMYSSKSLGTIRLMDNDYAYISTSATSPFSNFLLLRGYDTATEFVLPNFKTPTGLKAYIKW